MAYSYFDMIGLRGQLNGAAGRPVATWLGIMRGTQRCVCDPHRVTGEDGDRQWVLSANSGDELQQGQPRAGLRPQSTLTALRIISFNSARRMPARARIAIVCSVADARTASA